MSLSRMELKNVKSLLTKKGRRTRKMFIAEGIRLLEESLRHKYYPDRVFYTPALLSKRGFTVLDKFTAKKIKTDQISLSHMKNISDTPSPQGIFGIFPTPDQKLKEPYPTKYRNILVCENISDPGNLGTLLRSALAFEFGMIILCGDCVDAFSPKVIRSTAGGVFGLKIFKADIIELRSFIDKTKAIGIGTTIEGDKWAHNLMIIKKAGNRLLIIGSEADGLSHEMKKTAEINLRINHSNKVESLNAGVAGSIIMKQVYDL
jgi:RNA methyltransferase, TrmH family